MTAVTEFLSVGERLDRLRPGSYLLKWTLFVRLALFWDFFDLAMAGVLLGFWLHSGASTPELNAAFISATAFGMLVGNIATAALVDRIGRKAVLQLALLLVATTSLLSAALPFSMVMLIALRFVCGVGMGSMPVPASLLLLEVTPAAARASWAFWSGLLAQAGLFASAVAGYLLLPSEGWRIMFAIPGASCLLLLVMSRVMPESPRWLAARGRDIEADAVIRKFERYQRIEAVNSPAPFTAPAASAKGSASPPISYLRLLVVACVMKTAVNAGIYLFMQWLPTIFLAMQVNLSKSLGYNLVIASGTLFSGIAGGLMGERVGRRRMILITSFLGACSAVSFTWLLKQSPMLGMAAGFFLLAILGYLGTLVVLYISEIFHTRIRGTYVGIATTVSRVSNIILPLGVVALTPLGVGYVVTGMIAGLLVAVMVAVSVVPLETAGVPLDAAGR